MRCPLAQLHSDVMCGPLILYRRLRVRIWKMNCEAVPLSILASEHMQYTKRRREAMGRSKAAIKEQKNHQSRRSRWSWGKEPQNMIEYFLLKSSEVHGWWVRGIWMEG
ncbi:Niemann-Pick C1 protein [Platysternon megacephalum]|uniref:Niemann-Pick C1 protein n=1 Tax=Platysternon megacephalum TaxID=55544 RepID=A0A4D9EMN8_9SAUR|nr:Niemann-Pick C1 protein [Platysternon megacephalum]